MNHNLSEKIIAYLALISGLAISAVAVWYSVAGLVSIFAASAVSIIIMGVVLELSKLVATVWLKWNWNRVPKLIKAYLISAITVLMIITSMGIFGYLSKAHLDQNIVSGDVQARIALVDEKIKIERENIANAQSLIKQMDAAVSGVIATGDREIKLRDGTTRIQSAAERSLQIRRSQARDRENLIKQIEQSQNRIVQLQEESAPIRTELRKVEAEVGPIKYIARLIYGDQPDQNMLEKAVTWVIIIIVFVFDPLAVILLLASQYSFQWLRQNQDEQKLDQQIPTEPISDESIKKEEQENDIPVEKTNADADATVRDLLPEDSISSNDTELQSMEQSQVQLNESGSTIKEIVESYASTNPIGIPEDLSIDNNQEPKKKELESSEGLDRLSTDQLETLDKDPQWVEAKREWKENNPDLSLKDYKKLYIEGLIDRLPWEDYLKKKEYIVKENSKQITKVIKEPDVDDVVSTARYIQNEEQSDQSLWNRIKNQKQE